MAVSSSSSKSARRARAFAVAIGLFGMFTVTTAATSTTSMRTELVVGLTVSSAKQQDLDKMFWKVSSPEHRDTYLQHLDRPALAEIVGAEQTDLDAVSTWLVAEVGCHSVQISALRTEVTGMCHEPVDSDSLMLPPVVTKAAVEKATGVAVDFVLRRAPRRAHSTQLTRERTQAKIQKTELMGTYDIASQKQAYGIPVDLQATNDATLQMVCGPGTFGYSPSDLATHKATQCPLLNLNKVHFDTQNHGEDGGDNFGEGNLDTKMISSFGLNVSTLVSNTNTSSSTEEGNGFGQAMLDFLVSLSNRKTLPQVHKKYVSHHTFLSPFSSFLLTYAPFRVSGCILTNAAFL